MDMGTSQSRSGQSSVMKYLHKGFAMVGVSGARAYGAAWSHPIVVSMDFCVLDIDGCRPSSLHDAIMASEAAEAEEMEKKKVRADSLKKAKVAKDAMEKNKPHIMDEVKADIGNLVTQELEDNDEFATWKAGVANSVEDKRKKVLGFQNVWDSQSRAMQSPFDLARKELEEEIKEYDVEQASPLSSASSSKRKLLSRSSLRSQNSIRSLAALELSNHPVFQHQGDEGGFYLNYGRGNTWCDVQPLGHCRLEGESELNGPQRKQQDYEAKKATSATTTTR